MNVPATVLNFGHELSFQAKEQLSLKFGQCNEIMITFAIDRRRPVIQEVSRIVETSVPQSILAGTQPFVVALPSLSIGVSTLLAYLHGRIGYFPKVLDLMRDKQLGVFLINDIIDLEYERSRARRKRSKTNGRRSCERNSQED